MEKRRASERERGSERERREGREDLFPFVTEDSTQPGDGKDREREKEKNDGRN